MSAPQRLSDILTFRYASRCECGGQRAWHPDIEPQRAGRPTCSFCGVAFTDVNDAWLELFDAPTLQYPQEPEDLLVAYAHADCGPDNGYNIAFQQLLTEGVAGDDPRSWLNHLLHKPWFCPTFATELEAAYKAAKSLTTSNATPMRSVMESIPRRRPKASSNPRSISVTMRARVMERDGFKCRRCGCGPNDAPLVVDHIVPVAKGGTGAFDNLQTLCRICNAGKSDAAPHAHDLQAGA